MPRLMRALQDGLRARSPWQALLVYLGFSFAVLQFADLFINRLRFPEWLFTATLILLLVGIPVIAVTAVLQRRPILLPHLSGDSLSPVTSNRYRQLFTWRNALGGGILAFAILGATSVGQRALYMMRGNRLEWARTTGMHELTRLGEDQKPDSAWTLAHELLRITPADSSFDRVRSTFADRVTIESKPAGAKVYRKPYAQAVAPWEYLGTTPLRQTWFPRGGSRLRLEAAAYESLETATSPGQIRRGGPFSLVAKGTPNMVKVGAGEFIIQSPGLEHLPPIELGDYLIDKFEVSNREYKRFVDGGGYTDRKYWQDVFVGGSRVKTWEEATTAFADRTGRAGPSTWEAGDYPDGEDDYPVSGVSWFEASAYARFVGKSLPTVYHWSRAAGTTLSPWIVPNSNFAGHGAKAVTRNEGLGPYGTFDMAGNVREWCLNASGAERFILGGGWNDATYMFMDGYAQSPWDRSETNGIRLVRYTSDQNLAVAQRNLERPHRDYSTERPVSDEVFAVYRRMYSYDRRPLIARIEEIDTTPKEWTRQRVSFTAAYGNERVAAVLFLPKHYAPPYQTVIIFPGSSALHTRSSKEYEALDIHGPFVKAGRAWVYPVYKSTFERGDGQQSDYQDASNLYKEHVIMWAKDLGRSIDYLESRPDIDASKLAYYGFSWGGFLGPIMLAVEPRFKAAILNVAGFLFQKTQPEVDPFNYASRVKIPVIMLNGRYDHFFPVETSQKPLYHLLGTATADKRHVISEGGHFVPRPQLLRESFEWLDRYLGTVQK